MPYPNEHSGRVRNPKDFVASSFRRLSFEHEGKSYSIIKGKLKSTGTMVIQALRYPVKVWTAAVAREHAKGHGARLFEPAAASAALILARNPPEAQPGDVGWRNTGKALMLEKDIARVGPWMSKADGWVLDITPERLTEWVGRFRAMKAAGIEVPILKRHQFQDDPEQTDTDAELAVGRLDDLWIAGDRLMGRFAFADEEAAILGKRAGRVSPGIVFGLTAGDGVDYGEVIEHVALTPRPVIPGQLDFKRIAAAAVLWPREEVDNVKTIDEVVVELGKVLGFEDLDVTNLVEKLTEQKKKSDDVKKAADELGAMVKKLETELAELKAAADKSKPDDKPDKDDLDPDIAEELADTEAEGFDRLVNDGKITPAVALSLKNLLVAGADKKPRVVCLSKRLSVKRFGLDRSLSRAVREALAQNDPVKLGEQTRAQGKTVALSRTVDGGDVSDKDADAIVDDMLGDVGKKADNN